MAGSRASAVVAADRGRPLERLPLMAAAAEHRCRNAATLRSVYASSNTPKDCSYAYLALVFGRAPLTRADLVALSRNLTAA
jgi:hypothetical protein